MTAASPPTPRPSVSLATADDANALGAMGGLFLMETGYGDACHRAAAHRAVSTCLATGFILMWATPPERWMVGDPPRIRGYIGVTLGTHPLTCQVQASEVGWWMYPQYRSGRGAYKLLLAAEQMSRERGAEVFEMTALTHRVGYFLARRGYTPRQVTYIKSLR